MSHLPSTQDPKILNAERILGRQFNNPRKLKRALHGNRSLTLLGESLIQYVLVREGLLDIKPLVSLINEFLQARACNSYLIRQGFSTGFVDCIYVNSARRNHISLGPVADAVEAVIAAVFFDSSEDIGAVESAMMAFSICWP